MFATLMGALQSVANVWDDCDAMDPQTNLNLPQTGKFQSRNWNSPLNVNMDDQVVMPITPLEPIKILSLVDLANQFDEQENNNAILLPVEEPRAEAEFRNLVVELENKTNLTATFEDALERADVELCNILVEKNLSKLGLEQAVEAAVIGRQSKKELLQHDASLSSEEEAQRRIQNALAIFYNAADRKECFDLFKESSSNARMLPQVQESLNKTALPEMQKVLRSQMSCAKRFFDAISSMGRACKAGVSSMGRACKAGVSNLRKRCMQNVSDFANLAIKIINRSNVKGSKLKKA